VQRIVLGALAPPEARRLAELASGGLEPGLAELACLRGGGNPLFVEEVARALRDGSPDLREAARLELSLARARERVPDTLWGVVAARIDALPESAKRVLEMAAVVGESFDAELVRDVVPGLADEPAPSIDLLVARGLLRPTADGAYDFCHGVVRSGAEAQLVRERLASLHRRIADALAKRPLADTAEGASRIGLHYDRAGEALAAIPPLLRAGQAYAGLRALLEAAAHLRRAFELLRALPSPPPELEAPVGLGLASALAALDRTGEAAAVLESLDLGRIGTQDRVRLAAVHIQAGWLRFSNENDVARGRALVERGLRSIEDLPEAGDARVLGWNFLTRIDLLDGRLEQALAASRRVAELASARGDRPTLAMARYNECAVHCEAGRETEARRAADETLALAGGRSELIDAAAHAAVARLSLMVGAAERALEAARRTDELAARCGQVGLRYLAAMVRGYTHLLRGESSAAHGCFESLAELGAQWPTTLLHRARGALEIGDLAAAVELARRALDAPRAIRARALAVLGLATGLGAGRSEEADAYLVESIDACDALGLRPWLAEAQGFQAELCLRRGDAAGAAHYAQRAADGYARCGMHVHAAQIRRLSERAAGAP
jgi:tetratricopeptide (TPR) repeat protein